MNNYQLNLSENALSATLIEMVEGDTDGKPSPIPISSGSVFIDVSERPVFLRVNDITGPTSTNSCLANSIIQ